MTRGELVVRLQNFFENTPYYPQEPDLNNSIQDGYDEVIAYAGLDKAFDTFPLENSKTYYDLRTIFPDLISVIAIFNPVTKRFLSPTSIRKLERYGQSWETVTGPPYFFSVISWRYIAIHPRPRVDNYGDMIVYYNKAASQLNTDNDLITGTEESGLTIERYCRTDLLEMGQEWTKAGKQFVDYMQDLEQLRTVNNKRSIDRIPNLRDQVGT